MPVTGPSILALGDTYVDLSKVVRWCPHSASLSRVSFLAVDNIEDGEDDGVNDESVHIINTAVFTAAYQSYIDS